jgi:hypothetical protein
VQSTTGLGARARRLASRARRRLDAESAGSPAPPAAPRKKRKPPRTAILVVNGFDRRGRWGDFNAEEAREFPWIDLCLQQIERHSRGSSYEVLVWDNTWMPEHKELIERHPRVRRFEPAEPGTDVRHGASLDRLVQKVRPATKFIITLDTDSFPVRDGWIENLTGRLNDDVLVSGAWRDEMLPKKPAFVHPCCLAVRKRTLRELGAQFVIGDGADVAHNVTVAVEQSGSRASKLRRSNAFNAHFLMGAVYGDLIYHQGAGSRAPTFSAKTDADHSESVRLALRDAAFRDLDTLVDALAGNVDPSAVPGLTELAGTGPVPSPA